MGEKGTRGDAGPQGTPGASGLRLIDDAASDILSCGPNEVLVSIVCTNGGPPVGEKCPAPGVRGLCMRTP
jgi:hypothetical protein